MQKNNWLRLGLAGIILAGMGAGTVLQGCGDDDVTPLDAGVDTATTNTTPTSTGSVPDSSVPDTFVPPVPESQKIIFVHAGNWMGASFENGPGPLAPLAGGVRLCLKAGPVGNNPFLPVPALPNVAAAPVPVPALLPGTGGVLPARTDFSTTRLEGYALSVQRLAAKAATLPDDAARTKFNNTPCGDLFGKGLDGDAAVPTDGGTNLVEGVDFLRVGIIEPGTFTPDATFVVTVQGCAPGYAEQAGVTAEMAAAKCGATYASATGNLKLKVQKVDRGAVGATELGAQFIHATTGAAPANPGVLPGGAVDGGADAAAFKAFSTTPPVAYDAPITPLVKLAGVSLTADALTVNPQAPIPPYSFASAIAATAGKEPVALGKGNVFVLVGEGSLAVLTDPAAPANRKLHFLAFPTNPVVPPLTQ